MGLNKGWDEVVHACGHTWRWQVRRKSGRPGKIARENWVKSRNRERPGSVDPMDWASSQTREERLAEHRKRVCPKCFGPSQRERMALAAVRTNARLRAWRAHGVPVEGGWAERPNRPAYFRLKLACEACGKGLESLSTTAESMAECERRAVKVACEHLAPLAGEMPEAVRALYELELVSGG